MNIFTSKIIRNYLNPYTFIEQIAIYFIEMGN